MPAPKDPIKRGEWIKKLRQRMSGEGNPMYGTIGELSPNYGKPRSEETIRKIAETKIKHGPYNVTEGKCVNLQQAENIL